jgi:hypothetical protein
MVLLGLVFYYRSSWQEGNHHHTNVSMNVNVFWSGGYGDESHWYGKLAAAYGTTPVPVVLTLLKLLFAVLAVGIKIALLQRWQPAVTPVSEPAGALPPEIATV